MPCGGVPHTQAHFVLPPVVLQSATKYNPSCAERRAKDPEGESERLARCALQRTSQPPRANPQSVGAGYAPFVPFCLPCPVYLPLSSFVFWCVSCVLVCFGVFGVFWARAFGMRRACVRREQLRAWHHAKRLLVPKGARTRVMAVFTHARAKHPPSGDY